MKFMLVGVVAALGLPALAQVVVDDAGRTYRVEVVSTDVAGRTITYRSRDGRATMTVADRAMGSLRRVRAGDTIDLTLRDRDGARREVVAIVQGTSVDGATGKVVATTSTPDVVTVVPGASPASVIRVADGTGADRDYTVDDQARLRFRPLRAGEKVLVSWSYTANGEPEAVVRIAHSPNGLSGEIVTAAPGTVSVLDDANPPEAVASAGTTYSMDGEVVQVVSSDLRARTLTVRSANGDVQTIAVAGRAMDGLRSVREGDSVTLSLADGRVVLISRP